MALSLTRNLPREDSSQSRKTSSALSSNSRKPTRALLSIKPVYAEAIFSGKKRFEFRRNIFRHDIRLVIVYMTSPVARVVGEFTVKDIITDDLDALWGRTEAKAGIGRDVFLAYFAGRNVGHAIAIGNARLYEEPLDLEKTYGVRPPQSFVYL